jgi:hypothetical protein
VRSQNWQSDELDMVLTVLKSCASFVRVWNCRKRPDRADESKTIRTLIQHQRYSERANVSVFLMDRYSQLSNLLVPCLGSKEVRKPDKLLVGSVPDKSLMVNHPTNSPARDAGQMRFNRNGHGENLPSRSNPMLGVQAVMFVALAICVAVCPRYAESADSYRGRQGHADPDGPAPRPRGPVRRMRFIRCRRRR